MSLMVQNNYLRESSMVANTRSKQSEEKVFSQELTSKQINGTEKTEQLTPEEELEVFKKEFYEELSKINVHQTISNVAINISEDAFKKMKEDPQYKQQILNLLKRDLGSSLAPRNCSAVFTVGSSLKDIGETHGLLVMIQNFMHVLRIAFIKRQVKVRRISKKSCSKNIWKNGRQQSVYHRRFWIKSFKKRRI